MVRRCVPVLILAVSGIFANHASAEQIAKRNIDLPPDTVLANGFFVKYEQVTDTSYILRWGNEKIERNLPEMEIEPLARNPWLIESNQSAMILEASCGSPCWHAYILPMDDKGEVQDIWYPLAWDLKNNLVVTVESENDTLLKISNFLSQTSTYVIGSGCGSAFFGYCVDSISLIDRELYVRYFTEYEFDKPRNERKAKEVRLSIDF